MLTRSLRFSLPLAGLLVLALAPPVAAHTGAAPSSPLSRAVTIGGIVLVAVGLFCVATGFRRVENPDGGRAWRRVGFPVALFGSLLVFTAPALVAPIEDLRCGGRPESDAHIAIVSPAQGEIFTTPEVPVEVAVTDGEVASAAATEHEPGTGHIHISVDGQVVAMVGKERQVVEFGPGVHTLEVEYSAGDHGSFCPPVVARRQVEVRT